MTQSLSNSNPKPWPRVADYQHSEAGWNQYANDWIARKRMTAGLSQIPRAAIEEHWAAMALGRDPGWKEVE